MPLDTATFDMQRSLPLPPEKLWDVLTDPKHREAWGAPDANTVLIVDTADVRVGGQDRHRCGPRDAPEFVIDTRWYGLQAPERAVFTETLLVGDETMFTSLVTYAVTPNAKGALLEITVAVSSMTGPEALQEVRAGWDGGLTNLDGYAASLMQAT
ncbi:MAG: SRPBCC domain-containing protein [Pseudomonadota bacterium]